MRLKQFLDRRAGYSLASLGLLLSMAAPAVIPAFASAEQLSARSIVMSSSAVGADPVSYQVNFTAPGGILAAENDEGGVIIDFCENTAVVGDTCDAPTDLDLTGATVTDVEFDGSPVADGTVLEAADNHIEWQTAAELTAGDTLSLVIGGIENPSVVGVFYARITTYANETNLLAYTAPDSVGTYVDEGSVALAATNGIGITSYVLEAMSFCVSLGNVGDSDQDDEDAIAANVAPSENCGLDENDCDPSGGVDPGCVVAPSMTIGEDDGDGRIVLKPSKIAFGQVWAQLSSNAVGNTVVNLKSDAAGCGGLYRNGNPANCDIGPKNDAGGISAGVANFGLTVGSASAALTAAGDAGNGSGTINTSGSYSDSVFFIEYDDEEEATGVTSTFGSTLFATDGAVDNMNVPVTFGATISNNTPAGSYGATLSMVAVGTF